MGEQIQIYQLARFTRTVAMLLKGGIPLVSALDMTEALLRQPALKAGLKAASQCLREGRGLADTFREHGLASEVGSRLLVVGEKGGELGDTMDKIAAFYDEDPVEYQLPCILQIPVNEKKGLSFALGLRSILRHDPDKILVGEIRDADTAQIAIQSALTGHLVFTSVHANNAFDVLGRFTHMNIDIHSFVSALNGVLAQRLMRIVCPLCAVPHGVDAGVLEEMGIGSERMAGRSALDGLARWLTRNNVEQGKASIVVSSRFVRYALVPWPSSDLSKEEGAAWARVHLETANGDMTGWTVACDSSEFGRAHVACAMPAAFLKALRDTMTARKISTEAIAPAFVTGWNAWRKRIKPGQFFGVAESERLVLGCCGHRGWDSLRVLSAKQSRAELTALTRREHALLGKSGAPRALLFAPGMALSHSVDVPNDDEGIQCLSLEDAEPCPALAMARLAAER